MLTFHNTILTYLFAYKLLANTKQHQQKEEKEEEKNENDTNSSSMNTLRHKTYVEMPNLSKNKRNRRR